VSNGYNVHATSTNKISEFSEDITWHSANLLDNSEVEDLLDKICPEYLLHFAWYTNHGKFWNAIENSLWVDASISLLKSFAKFGGERAVFAGSCAEYDWDYGFCNERITPTNPTTMYGTCKYATNIIVSSLAKELGISLAWGRIFSPFGPFENPQRLIPSMILSMLNNKNAVCNNHNLFRDFMFVNDVARAFVALLNSSFCGNINISSGEAVSLAEVVLKIAHILNKPDLVKFGSLPTPQREPKFLIGDNRLLTSCINFKPVSNFETGIHSTITWWKLQKGFSNAH
jgi:nucleoside-diphosphate-sugar epimerase